MLALNSRGDVETFFSKLAEHTGPSLLLLDFDGTLAPFVDDRNAAKPYPGVVERLQALAEYRTRSVVISGRSIEDLVRLLDIRPLPELWGSHGRERRLPDGTYTIAPLLPDDREGLARARALAVEMGLEPQCEVKPASVALHWRGLSEAQRAEVRERCVPRWKSIEQNSTLVLHPFDGGVELKAGGATKGTAIETLSSEIPRGTPMAYLGDDKTDEDAFEALGERGLSVLVRTQRRPTAADLWIEPPSELLEFLDRWQRARAAASAR